MPVSATAAAAVNAYTATSKIAGAVRPEPQQAAGQPGFAEMVQQALDTVSEAGKQSDKVSMEAVAGKANIVDVVTAVAETELALETLVSVRDRMISAYEEIMRMPI